MNYIKIIEQTTQTELIKLMNLKIFKSSIIF